MKPNILLITVDDMNYDSLGCTGCKVNNITPHIDRLASEGFRFKHSHVTISVCQPSRSVLMTGRYPHRNGALGFEPIDNDVPTLQEQLKSVGYINGIIGKEWHLAPAEKFCWDTYIRTFNKENGMGRDPDIYYKYSMQFFQKAKKANKPFFLMANSHDPHRPFPGSRHEREKFGFNTDTLYTYKPEDVTVPGFLPDIPDVRKEIAQYYSAVHRADQTMGQVLKALEDSGFYHNTLVMFLSDNGMAFPFAKTNCYLTSTRTPWIIRWPGKIKPGTVEDEHMISGIDYMPTILDVLSIPCADGLDGESFLPVLLGENQNNRNDVFTVFNKTAAAKKSKEFFGKSPRHYPMRCIQNKQFGYIYNAWSDNKTPFINESQSGLTFNAMTKFSNENPYIRDRVRFFQYRVKEEFYDFENDPDALVNLIDKPEYQKEIEKMRRKLSVKMKSSFDPLSKQFMNEQFMNEIEVDK